MNFYSLIISLFENNFNNTVAYYENFVTLRKNRTRWIQD
jgi:hypothetical protein